MYYDKVMSSIIDNDMDPLLRLKFASECVLFLWTLFFIIAHVTISLKCLINGFASVSIPQKIGNLLSLLECLTEDRKKGWAWFKLTTRETNRSDETKYE